MAAYQSVQFFRQFEKGWTETYYHSSPLAGDAFKTAFISNVIPKSLKLRDPSVTLAGITIRNFANPRESWPKTLEAAGTSPIGTGNGGGNMDITNVCLQIDITSQAGHRRKVWARGLADAMTIRDDKGRSFTGAFSAQVRNYFNALQTYGACVKFLEPLQPLTPASQLNWHGVKNFGAVTGNEQRVLVTVDAGTPTFLAGDVIYFRGLENPRFLYLRGRFRVIEAITPTSFTIAARWREAESSVTCLNTQLRLSAYTISPITSMEPGKFATRDTGRPTNGPRGRRSALVRRR